MVTRPRPERFIDAGKVLFVVGSGRLHAGARSAKGLVASAVRTTPVVVAHLGHGAVDCTGRLIRGTGLGLRRAAGRVEHVVER